MRGMEGRMADEKSKQKKLTRVIAGQAARK